jgi:hypothetical protein
MSNSYNFRPVNVAYQPSNTPFSNDEFEAKKARLAEEASRSDTDVSRWFASKYGYAPGSAPDVVFEELAIGGRFPDRATMFCSGCEYFEPSSSGDGECRKNPPSRSFPQWPRTARGAWCGAFSRRREVR